MTKPKNPDETTLLIKLPPELKASFQGLCKFRGVSVSEELRRFMADEVSKTARGMTTMDKPATRSHARVAITAPVTAVVPKKSFKDAVQAELLLPSAAASAINASAKRKKPANTAKKKKR